MIIHPANESFIIESVKEGSLEIGFLLDLSFADPELHCIPIREEELVIVTHPDHRFAGRSEIRVQDLENESLILTEEGCTHRAMLLGALQGNQVNFTLSYEFGSLEAIKQCVMYGLGITLLPRLLILISSSTRRSSIPRKNGCQKHFSIS